LSHVELAFYHDGRYNRLARRFIKEETIMAIPVSFYSLTLADNTVKANGEPETTSTSVPTTTLTPANVAAQATLGGNLKTAIAAITLGTFMKDELTYARAILGNTPASSNLAQRENKWLLRYHDATNYQKYSVSVGTADLSLLPDHTEFLDLTAGAGAGLKTAFEAFVVSPNDASHSVILDSAQFVGRNS